MLKTYPATIVDGQIHWAGGVPTELATGLVEVQGTIDAKPALTLTDDERRARLKVLMERMAARGGIASIPDAVAWQREIRKDRPLPGRDLE